jgi:hypothetical protein
MNIENLLFKDYKKYIETNSKFEPTIVPSSNKDLTKFPTILFKEQGNIESERYTTLNRIEYVDEITLVIEIYSQPKTIGNKKYASKTIIDELKFLTFDFFRYMGCTRISCEPAEYYNKEVDRLVIMYNFNINSWNNKIN